MTVQTWVEVPANTPAAQCRSCHQTIYWVCTFSGKRMPVDCDVEGGQRPRRPAPQGDDGHGPGMTFGMPGRGVSHFATCGDADRWRKPR